MKFRVGDPVERLWKNGIHKRWEEGYTVIERPENAHFEGYIYVEKPKSQGFDMYSVGLPPEHVRHAINPKTD